jgi:hypothetical protein
MPLPSRVLTAGLLEEALGDIVLRGLHRECVVVDRILLVHTGTRREHSPICLPTLTLASNTGLGRHFRTFLLLGLTQH